MNKTKVFGYAVGAVCIGWAMYNQYRGDIVFAVIFFGLGCLAVELAINHESTHLRSDCDLFVGCSGNGNELELHADVGLSGVRGSDVFW
jgi:hypothetical protein